MNHYPQLPPQGLEFYPAARSIDVPYYSMNIRTMRARIIGTSALALGTLALPALASAQTLLNTLAFFNTVLNAAIGLLITLAIIAFFYGGIRYLFSNASEAKADGLKVMLYGIITIFVMVSVWGLVRLLQSTFGVGNTTPVVPQGIQINTFQ